MRAAVGGCLLVLSFGLPEASFEEPAVGFVGRTGEGAAVVAGRGRVVAQAAEEVGSGGPVEVPAVDLGEFVIAEGVEDVEAGLRVVGKRHRDRPIDADDRGRSQSFEEAIELGDLRPVGSRSCSSTSPGG